MSLTFRYASPGELPEICRLVAHSFPGPTRTPEWWLEQLGHTAYGDGPEILWVGEERGRIVAMCQLHRLREWVTGAELSTMGLGTVTIAPTHRQRGLASRLVASGMRAARERGDVASALFPFRVTFYGKLGYGLAGEALQYRVPPDALPASDARLRVELADSPAARAEVRELYGDWIRTQNGQVTRTERSWEQLLAPPDRALVAYRGDGGAMEGYARVIYRTDLPPGDRFLEVDELVWTTVEARRGLYGWLATLGDQWSSILLRALPEHRLGDWLREPRMPWGSAPGWGLWLPSATLLGGPMFRLLQLQSTWASRAVDPEARIALALDVHDPQLEENSGAWRLSLADGRVGVERGSGPADVALSLSIQTLSRLFIGALSPSAALAVGLLTTDRPDLLPRLDRALQTAQPWTFDRF